VTSSKYSPALLLYLGLPLLLTFLPGAWLNAADTTKAGGHATEAHFTPVVQRVMALNDVTGVDVVLDTRPLSSCVQATIAGARCLPVEDVLAPNRRLANWSGILWLLGTAGLSGHEHVLVIGQRRPRRHFIAGLLLLAGQHRVTIVDAPVSELLADGSTSSPGAGKRRATTRTIVYTAPMRSSLIVLHNEVINGVVKTAADADIHDAATAGAMPAAGTIADSATHTTSNQNIVLLDGRTESEYYGVTIRSVRGGHLPGAIHSPMTQWQQQSDSESASALMATSLTAIQPIAYAHDAMESLGYLALLHAAGVQARVYTAGWAEWSANTALPADSVSYADSDIRKQRTDASVPVTIAPEAQSVSSLTLTRTGAAIASVVVASLILAGFFAGRKFSTAGA
jgi:thiosulfate/3-mercaptopyruvate sulfurtransferase